MLSSSGSSRSAVGPKSNLRCHLEPVDRLSATHQRLKCWDQAEIIESGWPQLRDEVAQAVDFGAKSVEYNIDCLA